MHKNIKLIMRTLLIVMLSFSIVPIFGREVFTITAEAAVKAPSVALSKKILYVGYKTYKVEFNGLSSKAIIAYKSSNTKVATVSRTGTVTPVAKGTATVTATVKQNGSTYTLKVVVTVKNPYLSFSTKTDYLNVNDTFVFTTDLYGLKDKVVWSVSDEAVATISSTGRLKAVSTGKVTVNAEAGGKTAKCEVTVGNNRLGTFSTNITCYDTFTTWITLSDALDEEYLKGRSANGTSDIFDFEWGDWENNRIALTIIPKNVGTDTFIISTPNTTDELHITINVVKKPAKQKELSAEEIYKKCGAATVEILATDPVWGDSQGSGFFIDNGTIVTNYHVIEGADNIQITTQNNKKYSVKSILGYDEDLDIAILSIDSKNNSLILSQAGAKVGEEVYALGSPFGLTGTLSPGMVTTASRTVSGIDCIQIDAPISPGNSGGPLLNSYGDVIGINAMYIQDGQNLNFAINIKEIQKISTNKPLSVADYYALYEKQGEEEFEANIIHEDPTVSQDPETCQYITAWRGVRGTAAASETGDCYWFTVTKPINLAGIIESDNLDDLNATGFELYDYNYDYYAQAQPEDGELYQYFNYQYLLPGDYFVVVYLPKDYNGEDVPYTFMLAYEDVE